MTMYERKMSNDINYYYYGSVKNIRPYLEANNVWETRGEERRGGEKTRGEEGEEEEMNKITRM